MSTGLIMVIIGSVGSLASLIYFFSINKKNQEQIIGDYNDMSEGTVVGSTVKATKNTNIEKEVILQEIKSVSGIDLMDNTLDKTELMDNGINETEIMDNGINETEIMDNGINETQIIDNEISETEIMDNGVNETEILNL